MAATHTRVSHCCRCTHSATGKQRPMKYGPQVASHHLPADTRGCRDRRIIYMPCRTSHSFGAVTDAWEQSQTRGPVHRASQATRAGASETCVPRQVSAVQSFGDCKNYRDPLRFLIVNMSQPFPLSSGSAVSRIARVLPWSLMELHRIPRGFHRIPRGFHGTPWNIMEIHGHSSRIHSVLWNFMENATEHSVENATEFYEQKT